MRRVMRSGPGGTWGPRLIGAYGVGLAAAGVFRPDPANGFPAGAPPGNPEHPSWHSTTAITLWTSSQSSFARPCLASPRLYDALLGHHPGHARWCVVLRRPHVGLPGAAVVRTWAGLGAPKTARK
jgi:Protein of unknown function (DUF998)